MSCLICLKCGADINESTKFCPNCGAPIIHTKSETVTDKIKYNTDLSINKNFIKDSKQNNGRGEITSLVLGIIGMVAWLIPIIGAPITIVGLIFGIKSSKTKYSRLAVSGIVLCIIGLLATTINASIGAYKGANGTLFQNNNSSSVQSNNFSPYGVTFYANPNDSSNTSKTFSKGAVYAKLYTKAPFNATKIMVYSLTNNDNWYGVITVDPNSNISTVTLKLMLPGQYKIVFEQFSDHSVLGEDNLTITN